MDKKELRQFIRNETRQYSSSQLEELSLSVLSRLNGNEHLQRAKTILMYYSLPDEVNTHAYIDQLLAEGKKILLPEVIDGENMVIREYTGKHDLKEGAFHIMEPIGSLFPEERYQELDLAIIPGMAFDENHNRLGRGKGYYDRFLQKIPQVYKIGICFPFQLVGEIPTEETDIKMDAMIG
mgnify:FL=1